MSDHPTPLLDSLDDPHGLMGHDLPEDEHAAAVEFVERVQAIRWELWSLLISLDNTQAVSDPASRGIVRAIDDLGVAARAEAAFVDGVHPDPVGLHLDDSTRRRLAEQD